MEFVSLGNERVCVPTVSRTEMTRGGEGDVEGHSLTTAVFNLQQLIIFIMLYLN